MVRFIQTSDWQIGMKASGLGEAGFDVREKRIESITNIFEAAKENKADFVLVCGDTFEHNNVGRDDVFRVIAIFNKYPEIPILLLPGNHDALGADCVYNRDIFSRVQNLTLLRTCDPVEVEGTTLHPIPIQSSSRNEVDTDKIPNVIDLDGIHIGVAHGSLKGVLFDDAIDLDYSIDPSCVERSGIDFLSLGHWHSHREYKDDEGIIRIAYSGTHEQTSYTEKLAGYCLLVEIDGKGKTPNITSIKCGQLKWDSIDFEIEDKNSLIELTEKLESTSSVDMLKLTLSGQLPLGSKVEFENLLEYNETQHIDFKPIVDDLEFTVLTNPEEVLDLGDPTLNQADNYLRNLLKAENEPEQRSEIVETLSLLQRLAEEAVT
ncbi:hypothetical protein ES703_54294 [subsurface metagenome]